MLPTSNMQKHRFSINIPKGKDDGTSRNDCTKTRPTSGETWNPAASCRTPMVCDETIWFPKGLGEPCSPISANCSTQPLLHWLHLMFAAFLGDTPWFCHLQYTRISATILFPFHSFPVTPQDLFSETPTFVQVAWPQQLSETVELHSLIDSVLHNSWFQNQ